MRTFLATTTLLLMALLLRPGSALKCYKCNGCETNLNLKETCRNVDGQKEEVACLSHKVHASGTPEAMTIKKCFVYEKEKVFECPALPELETISCHVCSGDLCNASSVLATSWNCLLLLLLVPKLF